MFDIFSDENQVIRRTKIEMVNHVQMVNDLRSVSSRGITTENALLLEVGILPKETYIKKNFPATQTSSLKFLRVAQNIKTTWNFKSLITLPRRCTVVRSNSLWLN